MDHLMQFYSQVGEDGILELHLDLGRSEASKEVVVIITALEDSTSRTDKDKLPWHELVNQTYGACAGLGLERQDQGEFERREPMA